MSSPSPTEPCATNPQSPKDREAAAIPREAPVVQAQDQEVQAAAALQLSVVKAEALADVAAIMTSPPAPSANPKPSIYSKTTRPSLKPSKPASAMVSKLSSSKA